jgi:hypothetical protein
VFRLRSFHSILDFLGRSIGDEPEYDVSPDPRTPPINRNGNPAFTMELMVAEEPPAKEEELTVYSHGKYYSINTTGPFAQWNRSAFQMLYLLFQMTITDSPRVGVPSITIAK